jgi:hypothetical protein
MFGDVAVSDSSSISFVSYPPFKLGTNSYLVAIMYYDALGLFF